MVYTTVAFPLVLGLPPLLRHQPVHRPVPRSKASWRHPQSPPRQNGKAHQEPLGAAHHPDRKLLYVPRQTNHQSLTRPDQVAASIEGYFWPKIFWDFLTTNLDGAVKPIPILQVVNTVFGLGMFALELPFKPLAGTLIHQSIEFRLMLMPLLALAAIVMYQGTNAAVYYFIGEIIYFWAYSDGEVRSFCSLLGLANSSRLFVKSLGLSQSGRAKCPYLQHRLPIDFLHSEALIWTRMA